METWYLLFGGHSEDGRGPGRYVGRTTDAGVAEAHRLLLAKDPYTTGYVQVVTDNEIIHASPWSNQSLTGDFKKTGR